ncbi:hypothetical protein HWC80_gp029 [Mycobacterium phage Indlulamithi]|uniref:Uncharacterized protein n=1 Tax=Mycobacterium phage Indlulamithi TaxID=2656582 RepID=A0A649VCJ1_9CAUD|nr:hypothetical protein HWC80_gp029 [Mycobacterium phage Indlulamithi]QGJ90070.1 hypothetical protein PBI_INDLULAMITHI_29 [Mycobacterium phage Indlulamithi]
MECYSCGTIHDSLSEQGFCKECQAVYDEGVERAKKIEDRHDELEKARETGDSDTVVKIVTEIAQEGVV